MITALLLTLFGALYLGANALVWSGQHRDSFAATCADSHRDPLVQGIALVTAALVIAANVYL